MLCTSVRPQQDVGGESFWALRTLAVPANMPISQMLNHLRPSPSSCGRGGWTSRAGEEVSSDGMWTGGREVRGKSSPSVPDKSTLWASVRRKPLVQSHVSSQCTIGAESEMAVVARLEEGRGGGVEVEGKTLLRLQTFGAPLIPLVGVIHYHLVRQEHLMRLRG